MTTASDDENLHFDDEDDELLAAALEASLRDQPFSGVHQNAGTSKYSDIRESFDGFDAEAGKSWIYPTNYPLRDYQFSIVQKGLFANTLVSLPTGLGKTFIAAVIMFNFYRWYPRGKIIFMAPTKPLVAQQIESCFNVMGISQNHMAEMTGSMNPAERKVQWKIKRMFFLTPQVMTNDISRGYCPAKLVKCLVVDEAHKALGNHPYAVVVKEVAKVNRQFRILALSATPGSDVKAVQQIITNLLITNVEIRMEDSIDIMPYTHGRIIEKIIVPLGDHLESVKTQFMQVIMIYVERLIRRKVLWNSNPESLTTYLLLKKRDNFRQNPPKNLPRSEFGNVEGDFAVSMSLYHAYELLQVHGLRSFYNFLKGILNGDKGIPLCRNDLKRNSNFCQLFNGLEDSFETPKINGQPSTSAASQSALHCNPEKPFVVSHPKMQKLEEIMVEHFQQHNEESKKQNDHVLEVSTRAMVFSQYRDSVAEITDLLNRHEPLIKAMHFIGQSSGTSSKGLTQKLQLQVVSKFRNGGFNTLVSTCVGEEGLDIGEVDLIVCYDAHKSPIRLVQRMGRTGRKRKGRIIMLITKGKEEHTYKQGQLNKLKIDHTIASGSQVYDLYPMNPRMVPVNIQPICSKISIVTEAFQTTSMIRQKANSFQKLKKGDSAYLTEDELNIWNSKFKLPFTEVPKPPSHMAMLSLQSHEMEDMQKRPHKIHLSLTDWLLWQNVQQPTALVNHSKKTGGFVEMMQTIQVYTQLEADNNSYGLELAPFLDKQDVLQHTEKEVVTKSHICDFFPVVSKSLHSSGGNKNLSAPVTITAPRKKRKFQRLLFSSDSDEDFCLTSLSRRKSAETDVSKAKGGRPADSDIKIVSKHTPSLLNPIEHFFHLPEDITEPPEPLGDEAVPRVRLKTPPPSPPQDIVTFRLWLGSFRSSDKAEQGNSSKISAICKQGIISDDLYANLDLGDWEEGGSDSIVAHGPPAIGPSITPKKGTEKALKSASTSPVFISSRGHQSTTENTEADFSPTGHRSMFSVTQLVDMLHTDSFCGENDDSDELPIVIKPTTSKYSFKSLSNSVHKDEQHTDKKCIPKVMPATKENQLKPLPPSLHFKENPHNKFATEGIRKRLSSSFNSVFQTEGRTKSGVDLLSHFPEAFNKKNQSGINKECPKMAVRPCVSCLTPAKGNKTDASKKSTSIVSPKTRSISSPIANYQEDDEPDIIPPSPRKPGMRTKFKYKFRSRCNNSEPTLHLVNSLYLSPIGVTASKTNEFPAVPARSAAALAVSTPARVPTEVAATKKCSSGLDLGDDDFVQHNRKRSRTFVRSPDVFNTSLPKRKTAKVSMSRGNFGRQYLEEEAEVDDLEISSDEDEHIPGIDHFEESFIDDRLHPTQFTQNKQDDTSTMAMYLKTLRSPPARPGAFKLPSREALEPKAHSGSKDPSISVFSQQPSSDDSDYLNDSFCVDNDYVEYALSQDAVNPTRTDMRANSTAKRKRIYMLDVSGTSSDEEQITEVKHIPDSDVTTRVILNKFACDAPKPGPSTSATASNADSIHTSRTTIKGTHDSPVSSFSNRVLPKEMYGTINSGPSTSTSAINMISPHSSGSSNISKAVMSSPPSSIEMANFCPVMLVNSQEMASGQEIISNLNVRHHAQVAIAKLNHCDYIISNRMAIQRKMLSDVANSALRRPLLLRIRDMISLFERPCLIIESDRLKPGEKPRPFFRTKYFDNTMACIAQTPVKILFSQSQEETAEILVDLSRREFRKGSAIDVPLEVDENKAKHLKFYSTLPNVSYIICLNFCANFTSIMEFLNSSVEELEEKGKISWSRAELIHRYLRHEVSDEF